MSKHRGDVRTTSLAELLAAANEPCTGKHCAEHAPLPEKEEED
jgi:hypothetical protein